MSCIYQRVYTMHGNITCELREHERSITEGKNERGCAGELLGLGKG